MKLTLLLLFTALFALQANNSYGQKTKISLDVENMTTSSVIDEIENASDFRFIYLAKDVDLNRKVTLKVKRERIEKILGLLFGQTNTDYTIEDTQILLSARQQQSLGPKQQASVSQDPIRVTGRITDESGVPLPGATVQLKGTNRGVSADFDGNYLITVPNSESVLVFTNIGFAAQEITVGNQTTINVSMAESVSKLDDVVVVGYGKQRRVELTGTVATVKAKDIENLPVANVNQAIQGLASGVFVANTSGAPGGATEILIRGQSSITAGNNPLYIIDGAPVTVGLLGNQTFSATAGPSTDVLSNLNPNDIASIEVLKDASAKAVYGARAANGVILITTKKGQSGKATINFSTTAGWVSPTNNYDLLNAEEYVLLQREAFTNDGQPIPDNLLNVDPNIDTDWVDLILRNSVFFHEYNLGIRGGNNDVKYFVSAALRDEEGLIRNNDLTRFTLRSNLEFRATDRLRAGLNISLGRINNNEARFAFSSLSNVINSALLLQPIVPARNEDGEAISTDPVFMNAVAIIEETSDKSTTDKVLLSAFAEYDILPKLSLRTNVSFDLNNIEENAFATPNSDLFLRFFGDDLRTVRNRELSTYNIEPFLKYDFELGKHQLDLILGTTFLEQKDAFTFVSGTDFPNDQLTQLSSAGNLVQNLFGRSVSGGTETAYSFTSIFLRANYNYNDKYLFSATIRRDGSSRFGPDTRYGNFWAVSGGWNFANEAFLENNGILSFGKLRASIGVTGNDQIGNFPSIGTWEGGGNYLGQSVLTSEQIANPDLKWEETRDIDLGLDLGFFNNRLEVGITYFNANTSNLLFSQPIPGSTGFTRITENVGKVNNKGFELDIASTNISTDTFRWRTQLNLTTVENEVISLLGEDPIGFNLTRLIEGEPINVFYGLDFLGVDPETGDAEYRDVNGDGVVTLADDRTAMGKAQPDFFGGLTNTLSYGNFTLDVFFQFVYGADIYNSIENSQENSFIGGYNASRSILNRWQGPGDITNVPRLGTTRGLNQADSDRFVEDGSYARLKNATLSYTFPMTVSSKLGISNARIFVSGQNLLTITNYSGLDPEVGLSGIQRADFPQTAIYSLGLNINF
ncbi:MAG: TonB-dependent receptor [Bacteroidota bacterium]